jgi:hypothetical protein
LSPQQRFVQVLYLNAPGRPGTLPELKGWVSLYNGSPNGQFVVSQDIEHSLEARDHLVKTWYNTFLGRQARTTRNSPGFTCL